MKSKKKRKLKKKWVIWLGLILLGFILYSNIRIDKYAKGRLYNTVSAVPHYHTALVLGTSPIRRNGGPNQYFLARIDAAANLYEAGKVDRILVSGDNRKKEYNERAVFIAGKKGIQAVGFNAADVRASFGFLTHVREWGARCKVFLDLLLGKKPHFLGDPVDIG